MHDYIGLFLPTWKTQVTFGDKKLGLSLFDFVIFYVFNIL